MTFLGTTGKTIALKATCFERGTGLSCIERNYYLKFETLIILMDGIKNVIIVCIVR